MDPLDVDLGPMTSLVEDVVITPQLASVIAEHRRQ
jgi:hypothetical protein